MEKTLHIDDLNIILTGHALDRYRERVKPGLLRNEAEADIISLQSIARLGSAPSWAENAREGLLATDPNIDRWLFLGYDVAFPLIDGKAITCIAKGGISQATRMKRKRRKVEAKV